ncbi:hypothetical protein ACU4GR_10645 (plasmid) [Methylobacterium oryzae CBMB20]
MTADILCLWSRAPKMPRRLGALAGAFANLHVAWIRTARLCLRGSWRRGWVRVGRSCVDVGVLHVRTRVAKMPGRLGALAGAFACLHVTWVRAARLCLRGSWRRGWVRVGGSGVDVGVLHVRTRAAKMPGRLGAPVGSVAPCVWLGSATPA